MKAFVVALALLTGCSGQTVGIIGPNIEVLMTPAEVDRMRTDLDFRTQALQGGSGYVVDCGTQREPYSGESTLFDQEWAAGQCNAIGADWLGGNGQIYFDLNEPIARWSNGASMNNTVRSSAHRATEGPNGKQMRIAMYRDFGGWGGGFHGIVPKAQRWAFMRYQTVEQCPVPYDCGAPPVGGSFYGQMHN